MLNQESYLGGGSHVGLRHSKSRDLPVRAWDRILRARIDQSTVIFPDWSALTVRRLVRGSRKQARTMPHLLRFHYSSSHNSPADHFRKQRAIESRRRCFARPDSCLPFSATVP